MVDIALPVDLKTIKKRNYTSYILDADIQGFFDHIDHEWAVKFVESRIKDPNIIRLLRRMLKAGIMKDYTYEETEEGSGQGSVCSPIIANIYMQNDFIDGSLGTKEAEAIVPAVIEKIKRISVSGCICHKRYTSGRLSGYSGRKISSGRTLHQRDTWMAALETMRSCQIQVNR